MLDFSGKVVWVTGGTSGIGLEVTLTLARLGARVFTNSRRPPEGDVLQRAGIEWGACDVSDWSAVRETAKRVESATGAIDVLISNAAVLRPGILVPTTQRPTPCTGLPGTPVRTSSAACARATIYTRTRFSRWTRAPVSASGTSSSRPTISGITTGTPSSSW